MRRFWKRGGLRLVGVLALVALLQPLPTSVLFSDDAGVIFSRCIELCDRLHEICAANCPIACGLMFPGNPDAQAQCQGECDKSCNDSHKDCRQQCKADRNATTRH